MIPKLSGKSTRKRIKIQEARKRREETGEEAEEPIEHKINRTRKMEIKDDQREITEKRTAKVDNFMRLIRIMSSLAKIKNTETKSLSTETDTNKALMKKYLLEYIYAIESKIFTGNEGDDLYINMNKLYKLSNDNKQKIHPHFKNKAITIPRQKLKDDKELHEAVIFLKGKLNKDFVDLNDYKVYSKIINHDDMKNSHLNIDNIKFLLNYFKTKNYDGHSFLKPLYNFLRKKEEMLAPVEEEKQVFDNDSVRSPEDIPNKFLSPILETQNIPTLNIQTNKKWEKTGVQSIMSGIRNFVPSFQNSKKNLVVPVEENPKAPTLNNEKRKKSSLQNFLSGVQNRLSRRNTQVTPFSNIMGGRRGKLKRGKTRKYRKW